MNASALLNEVADLSPAARRSRLAEVARAADGDLDALCRDLEAHSTAGAETAIALARAAGLTEALRRGLDHADGRVRALAASALPAAADLPASVLLAAYRGASTRERRALLRGILRERRGHAADVLIPEALTAGRTREAVTLLPLSGEETYLFELLPLAAAPVRAVRGREDLARPRLLELLREATPLGRERAWARYAPALTARLGDPEAATQILDTFAAVPPLTGWGGAQGGLWDSLLGLLPEETSALLTRLPAATSRPYRPSSRIARGLAQNPGDALLGLLLMPAPAGGPSALLTRIVLSAEPPRATALLATLLDRGLPVPAPGWPGEHRLPAAARIRAARERVRARPETVGPELARLAFPEALAALTPLRESPEAELRGTGYALSITAAGFGTAADLNGLLTGLTRLARERDPVREHALSTLAGLPLRALGGLETGVMATLARDALAAADRSAATLAALRNLAARLLAPGSGIRAELRAEAVSVLIATVPAGGYWPDLAHIAPSEAETLCTRALGGGPLANPVPLLRALGPRARGNAAGEAALLAALPEPEHSRAVVSLLLADPATRVNRTRTLLAADPGLITHPGIADVVSGAASDLITPALLHGPAGFRPDTARSAGWDGGRRALVAHTLIADDRALRAASAGHPEEWATLRRLSALAGIPGEGLGYLRERAGEADPADPSAERVRERVLLLLGARTEDHAGDDLLLDGLGSASASAAGAALIRRAGILRPSSALGLIHTAASAAIGVVARKALLEAVDRVDPAERGAELAAVAGPDPHPDVAFAAASVAARRPASAEGLTALRTAVPGEVRGITLLSRIDPDTLPPAYRSEYAALLISLCGSPESASITSALTLIPRWVGTDPALDSAFWATLPLLPAGATPARAAAQMLSLGAVTGFPEAIADLLARDVPARGRLRALLFPPTLAAAGPLPDAAARALLAAGEALTAAGLHARTATALGVHVLIFSALPVPEVAAALSGFLGERGSVAAEAAAGDLPLGAPAAAAGRLGEAADVLLGPPGPVSPARAILAVEFARRALTAPAVPAGAVERLRSYRAGLPEEAQERALDIALPEGPDPAA